MRRKLLACVLTAAMTASILSGCGGGAPTAEESTTTPSAEQTEEAPEQTEEDTQKTEEADVSAQEPYTVKIVCVGDATTEATQKVADAISEITVEKYNTTVDITRLSYGSFADEVNLMLSSGEKLDLFPNFVISLLSAANNGQIVPLDDLLQEYGQDILQDVPEAEWGVMTLDGQIYGVPNSKDKAEGFGIAVRTDMLEATGYDVASIKSEADLEGLFAAVKEAYPECYPLVSDNGQIGYYNIPRDDLGGDFGWLLDCINSDDLTVVDWYESDEYYEMTSRRYDWAQKGYIMPDAATNTQNAYELMAAGKGFGYFCNTKPGIENEWYRKCGVPITVIELVDGYRTSASGMNTWFIAHNSEKPERAMQILNEMRSNPEISNLLINGIEGEHYVKKDDGTIGYPEGVDASNTTYSSVAWIWPNELISYPWEADGPDIWKETDEFNQAARLSTAFGFIWNNAEVLNEITACNNVTAKYKDALDCGSLNPEEAVPKMIQELKDAGIDTIIAEKQAQLDNWAAQK